MLDSPELESLFVRLYLDRHIMARLANVLRGRGFDVLRTEDAGNDTASDDEQLAFSTAENRSILTFNTCDFATLHEQWLAQGRPHAGIMCRANWVVAVTAPYSSACCDCLMD